jgi:hypothetical protein
MKGVESYFNNIFCLILFVHILPSHVTNIKVPRKVCCMSILNLWNLVCLQLKHICLDCSLLKCLRAVCPDQTVQLSHCVTFLWLITVMHRLQKCILSQFGGQKFEIKAWARLVPFGGCESPFKASVQPLVCTGSTWFVDTITPISPPCLFLFPLRSHGSRAHPNPAWLHLVCVCVCVCVFYLFLLAYYSFTRWYTMIFTMCLQCILRFIPLHPSPSSLLLPFMEQFHPISLFCFHTWTQNNYIMFTSFTLSLCSLSHWYLPPGQDLFYLPVLF